MEPLLKALNIGLLKSTVKSGLNQDTKQRAINKLKILERDGYACVLCGCKHSLTIDHIVKNKSYKLKNAESYDPKICRTLCVKCHINKHTPEVIMAINRKVKLNNRKKRGKSSGGIRLGY